MASPVAKPDGTNRRTRQRGWSYGHGSWLDVPLVIDDGQVSRRKISNIICGDNGILFLDRGAARWGILGTPHGRAWWR